MKNYQKYTRGFFVPPKECNDWTKKSYIDRAPAWCSVDLRDGNQSLVVPMSLEEKLEYLDYLVKIGFKEIEVSFPASSETDFDFTRKIIDENLLPKDVTIQVLTQSRPHIIERTFAAVEGANSAIVHLYNSTSVAQREQVFRKSKSEIIDIAVAGAEHILSLAKKTAGNFTFEYSPESFTGTEPEFALQICNRVLAVWQPDEKSKVIINLPVTVSMSMPHVYASQVEFMSKNLKYRDNVILSVHPHNDRGTGVADAELALLAGGQRIEGTLFGNGERTGNVDIVTLALNMYSQGIDPMLDFSDIDSAVRMSEKINDIKISPRHPYAGELVYTAFSGSHQDAIAKGLKWRGENPTEFWSVPYLLIDPTDVGRGYDGDVIRINSQSGKGGIGFLLEKFGYFLPPKMREDCGYKMKSQSDHLHKELKASEILELFTKEYVNISSPVSLSDFTFKKKDGVVSVTMHIDYNGETLSLKGVGNGQLDAAADAMQKRFGIEFSTSSYSEHALGEGNDAQAAAYVGITLPSESKSVWAAGVDTDIMTASIKAMLGCINKVLQADAACK